MGFELTSQVAVTANDLETIKARNNPTADYFYRNSLAWCEYWTRTFPVDQGFHPWDSAAIAWLLNKDWFTYEERGAAIQRDPDRFECDITFPDAKHTYCTGFTDGGAQAFVDAVVANVY